jgi:hypothetical protein
MSIQHEVRRYVPVLERTAAVDARRPWLDAVTLTGAVLRAVTGRG